MLYNDISNAELPIKKHVTKCNYRDDAWQKTRAANKSWVGHNYVYSIYQHNFTPRWTFSLI